jgi:hypothetical protein
VDAQQADAVANIRYHIEDAVRRVFVEQVGLGFLIAGFAVGDQLELVLAGEHGTRHALFVKVQSQRRERADDLAALAAHPDIDRETGLVNGERESIFLRFLVLPGAGHTAQRAAEPNVQHRIVIKKRGSGGRPRQNAAKQEHAGCKSPQ